jgi:hypothetical protein
LGQLIKLQDYISRYETDVYRYPSQFIRLKKQQWERAKSAWENDTFHLLHIGQTDFDENDWFENDRKPFLTGLKQLFSRRKKDNKHVLTASERDGVDGGFTSSIEKQPKSLNELKLLFLENLIHFQIKWASSTIREKSFVDREFYHDENLNYFLQRFPDTFLVLYKPILLLKSAPIEVEIIIITPICTYCITFLEGEDDSVFIGSKERFWSEKRKSGDRKVLNPLISLNRMEKIVKKLFQYHEVEMPIKKVVLNRTGFFDYPFQPYDVEFIEKRNYQNWFQSLRKMTSPLKHSQLKAAQALLIHSQTTCVKRLEWEEFEDDQFDF